METVWGGGGLCFFRFPSASYGRIFVRNNFYIILKKSLGTKLGTQLIQLGFPLMQYITLVKTTVYAKIIYSHISLVTVDWIL